MRLSKPAKAKLWTKRVKRPGTARGAPKAVVPMLFRLFGDALKGQTPVCSGRRPPGSFTPLGCPQVPLNRGFKIKTRPLCQYRNSDSTAP